MNFHLEVTLEEAARAEISAPFWMFCFFFFFAMVQVGLSRRSSGFKGEGGSHLIVHCLPCKLRVLSRIASTCC